jgi:hypothetical protein
VIDVPILLSIGPQLFMVAKFPMKEARALQRQNILLAMILQRMIQRITTPSQNQVNGRKHQLRYAILCSTTNGFVHCYAPCFLYVCSSFKLLVYNYVDAIQHC